MQNQKFEIAMLNTSRSIKYRPCKASSQTIPTDPTIQSLQDLEWRECSCSRLWLWWSCWPRPFSGKKKVLGVMEMKGMEMALEFWWSFSKLGMNIASTHQTSMHIVRRIRLFNAWFKRNGVWWTLSILALGRHNAFSNGDYFVLLERLSVLYDPFCLAGQQTLDFVTLWSNTIQLLSSELFYNSDSVTLLKSFQMLFSPWSFFLRPQA